MLKPVNNKGSYKLKLKITSELYGFTYTTAAWTIKIENECLLTSLTTPLAGNTIPVTTTYIIKPSAVAATITLFNHVQDADCKFDNEAMIITPSNGSTFASHSAWITLSGLVLTINSVDESLASIILEVKTKGRISANGSNIDSPEYTFTIILKQ